MEGILFCPRRTTPCVHAVCINTSCTNAAGTPHIYFLLINSIDIVFLTPQYGNLIDFASVYKRIINSRVRSSWVAGMRFSGRGRGSQGCPAGELGLSILRYWSKRLWAKWVARRDGHRLLDEK